MPFFGGVEFIIVSANSNIFAKSTCIVVVVQLSASGGSHINVHGDGDLAITVASIAVATVAIAPVTSIASLAIAAIAAIAPLAIAAVASIASLAIATVAITIAVAR